MTLHFICFPFASLLNNGQMKGAKRIVDGARAEGQGLFIRDSEMSGFGLRVRAGAGRNFVILRRSPGKPAAP